MSTAAKQLELQYEPLITVDVNGAMDERHGIRFIGKASKQLDGKYRCLANVDGALALVEVNIRGTP